MCYEISPDELGVLWLRLADVRGLIRVRGVALLRVNSEMEIHEELDGGFTDDIIHSNEGNPPQRVKSDEVIEFRDSDGGLLLLLRLIVVIAIAGVGFRRVDDLDVVFLSVDILEEFVEALEEDH